MRLGTYAHVIHELHGGLRPPAAEEIARARDDVERGHRTVLREALG